MKLFSNKRIKSYLLTLIGGLILFSSSLLHSQSISSADTLDYKKQGFQLGAEIGGLIALSPDVIGAPGKLDFLIGYKFNPYFTLNLDLWTFWFLAYVAEINPKVNFSDSKFSPYLSATFGGGGAFFLNDEDNDIRGFLTYSAGPGNDMHLWKKTTLFTEIKYRGATNFGDERDLVHGLELGFGVRWTF